MTSDSSKRRLDAALLAVMREKPFDEIRTKDITDVADVSRRTFYRFYHNKEEMLTHLISENFTAHFQRHLMTNGFDALYPVAEAIESKADSYRYLLDSTSGRRILAETINQTLHPYIAASIRNMDDTLKPQFLNITTRHCCDIFVDLIAEWLDGTAPDDVTDAATFTRRLLSDTKQITAIFSKIAKNTLQAEENPKQEKSPNRHE